jgi:hypothetical protein
MCVSKFWRRTALLVLYGKLVRHGGGHFDACRKKVLVKEY